MPRTIAVKISWTNGKALDTASLARAVAKAITGNTNFPTPAVLPADLITAAERTETAWADRANGPVAKQELENALQQIDDLLHDEADYVTDIAKGNATIIVSSGFEATSIERQPATLPDAPKAPRLTPLPGGRLKIEIDKVADAKDYTFVVSTGDKFEATAANDQLLIPAPGGYIVKPNSSVREEVSGLKPGSEVLVAAIAHNSAGNSAFSPVASSFIIK